LFGVVGAAFGFRAAARELLDLVPVAGWAVKGGVAYTGTRALGEAAVRYFDARAEPSGGPGGTAFVATSGRGPALCAVDRTRRGPALSGEAAGALKSGEIVCHCRGSGARSRQIRRRSRLPRRTSKLKH